jgi:outer membrane protein assembly factor BamB
MLAGWSASYVPAMTDQPARLPRRSLLSAAALAAGAGSFLLDGIQGRPASAAPAVRPAPETFGTAAATAAIVGWALDGDGRTAYAVTRGQTPPKVVTLDLESRAVTRIDRIPKGDGGWAATVSNGQVYVGTYPQAELYRYDPATGESELLGKLTSGSGFVWCLTTAPDGMVYAGTSPGCGVWEYNPSTKALRNLGRAHTAVDFARVITADDRFVYVGTTPERHVVAIDRATGERRDILPPELVGPGAIYDVRATGSRVLAATGGSVYDLAPDGSDVRVLTTPVAEPLDAMTVTADGEFYCIARRDGGVFRRNGDALELIARENVGDENRGLLLRGDHLIVAGGSGGLWYRHLPTGESTVFDLTGTDVAGPDLIQSIALDPGRAVYVGGHNRVTEHKPWEGSARRFPVAGEAKALLPLNGKVIAALYPSSEVIELDPATGAVRSFGRTGLQRPWEMVHDRRRGLVLIASAPGTGIRTGALTILDLATGRLQNYPDVLPDQAVMSVTVDGGIAYLAGDTYGGGSVTPTRTTAQVAAFDLRTRTVRWRIEPLPAQPSLQHIEVHKGVLYGVCKRTSGRWFALDLATRTVRHQGTLSGYGEVVVHRDTVYAATNFGDDIAVIGPDLAEARVLYGDLATSWYTVPQLEFEPGTWKAWGAASRDLARFDLRPQV